MEAAEMANEQVSLPYLVVFFVVLGLVTRYLFFSSPAPARQPNPAREANLLRVREAAVQRIQQMFPQVDRRAVLWDLQRNGGSIQATSERILSGRMETPPVTFQPPPPPGSGAPNAPGASAPQQGKQPEKPAQPDLITRYNLKEKLAATAEDAEKKGWSSNKEERQTLLQRRRDEMILAARRKMEAKIAAEKTVGGT